MTRIVAIDYDLVGNTGNPTLYNFLDGRQLELTVVAAAHITTIALQHTATAHRLQRGLFGFEIDQSIQTSSLVGNIHAAVAQFLGPRMQMQVPLANNAICMTVSGSTHGHPPEVWQWDATSDVMDKVF